MGTSRLTALEIRRAKAKPSVYLLCDVRSLSLRIEPSRAKL
jgi:hypothetical protein